MEKGDRQNGASEQIKGSREPQGTQRPEPGKVTLTSQASPGRGAAVQRMAAAPPSGTAAPRARSLRDLSMDPWMDAAHRGSAAFEPAVQLQAKPASQAVQATPDVYSAADAAAVKDTWAKDGALTETDTTRTTVGYQAWKKKFTAALAKERGKKKPSLTADELTAASDWVTKLEARERWKTLGTGAEPADPGAAPAAVATLAGGAAPALVFEKIKKYDVTVPGGEKFSYTDHVRSKYTVRDEGVGSVGTVGGKTKISDVFDKAGVPASDPALVKKVFSVLSSLEGNFDAINTYDAGYISVGLIQFISGKGGSGSLITVLRDMKTKAPAEFNTYFHALGIDVDDKGLVVVDPASGTVLHGEDAVQKVIEDKRLSAQFQKAGAQSAEFQYAQARTAYAMYYVPDKSFSLNLKVTKPGDTKPTKVSVSGSYKDVLTSEAGKVAIVDRGVQFGTGGGTGSGGAAGRFLDACQEVVSKHKLTAPTASVLAKYEKEIVARVQNRYNVSGDASLTQPPEPPAAANQPAAPAAATPSNTP